MPMLREAAESELEPRINTTTGGDEGMVPQSMPVQEQTEVSEPVGVSDPNPTLIEDPVEAIGPDEPPIFVPPSNGDPIDDGGVAVPDTGDPVGEGTDTTVQDLYPDTPEGGDFDVPDVPDATGATVTETDPGAADVDSTGATNDTGAIVDEAVDNVVDAAGTGEQTGLTPEQQVDAELARILGQDSPLLASARAEAMRQMNARGLTNTSMAAGATYGAMVDAALPMAQQNADQAFQRELANTELRQQAGQFTAEQLTQLAALEAELGQELSIFNADQLNQASRLAAELRTALEQQDAQAYNDAAQQLADLQRDAEAQQAEMEYGAEEREFLERQAYNEQIIDAVSRLNEQFMIGEQQIDLENIRGTYNQIISTNETAATIFDSYIRSIGSIFDDPDMSSAQAGEAIRAMVDMMESSLRMISEINGMDLGDDILAGNQGAGGTTPGTGPGRFPNR